ncbi:MAG TPA: YoaK family protein [Aldersonia sp.]
MTATATASSLRFALVLTMTGGFLDAYTYISRGGVFANAQTGNVILLGVDLSDGRVADALHHLWPILAFVAGVALANFLKSERAQHTSFHPLRSAVALQVVVLTVVGFLSDSVPDSAVTIPIAFVAAMQMGLFRAVGEFAYIAIATTGNLMRFTESGYRAVVEHKRDEWRAVRVYAAIVVAFAVGAVIGAILTRLWHTHAAWVPAALLAATLVLFVLDERAR